MKIQPRPLRYPNRPISSLAGLAAALRVPVADLQRVAEIADTQYRNAKPIIKPDGGIRQPLDALPLLKGIQKRIKVALFLPVEFPEYLTGSIRGRDARCNALLHTGAKIVVCEDIEKFFPSTTAQFVRFIWTGFFGFAPEVADLLTALTTKGGVLPEGAVTSSYLANLIFWNREPSLYRQFNDEGVSYSRYVDDITISSKTPLSKEQLSRGIGRIYGMMRSYGFKAKRGKQEIRRASGQMYTTKLMVNRRASLPSMERQAIRAAVFQLERRWALDGADPDVISELNSVAGRVGRLAQLHPTEGAALKKRIAKLRRSG